MIEQIKTILFVVKDQLESVLNWGAIGVGLAVFAEWIPPIAGLFSIAWLGTQLYDYWFIKRKG